MFKTMRRASLPLPKPFDATTTPARKADELALRMATDKTRMTGCVIQTPGVRHALVAFRRALAMHGASNFVRRQSVTQTGMLALEVGQLKHPPLPFHRSNRSASLLANREIGVGYNPVARSVPLMH